MRRFSLFVAATSITAAVIAPGATGTAGEAFGLDRRPVTFEVGNPQENGAVRTVAGYRYDPPCKASTVVLLQHGLSYTKEAWDFPGYSVARPLAEAGYAVVAIDRLGYGESKLEDGYKVSQEAFAEMTRQMVTQLRKEFDHVILGGHSAGGGVSMLTQGLFGSGDAVMVLGWHHRPSDEIVTEFMTRDTVRATQDDYEYFLETPEHRADMFFTDQADPEVVRIDRERAVLTPSGEVLTISKQPSRYVTPNIRVPVFLQLSEFDRLFEPRFADQERQLLSNSPSVTVDVVPGAGHTFQLHPAGRDGTARLVDWVRGRPEAPACSAG
jgi:pimeloyl-ACP methyl ester carboxylesterase